MLDIWLFLYSEMSVIPLLEQSCCCWKETAGYPAEAWKTERGGWMFSRGQSKTERRGKAQE